MNAANRVAVMGLCGAEHLHYAGQQSVDTGAHVDGLNRQPDDIDADHRRNSRSQAAHSEAAEHGQLTLIATGPRRTSSRMSVAAGAGSGGGICTGTNAGAALFNGATDVLPPRPSASTTHRRARFALMPWAMATAALDRPGTRQAAITCALNSALWVRRLRPLLKASLGVELVRTSPPKT